ncbi:hypothetical protein [Rufibacter roseus]|uniref:Uncharacterized protein n=1 Tax=Rufibacter roseus TaxID=1567108 RepID=A0ABW2DJ00_9BACT|nr:hypothetical protein [Rufibacter roseus]
MTGCYGDKVEEEPTPTTEPFQPQLPKLERPDIILNELAKGEFHNGAISAVVGVIPNSPPRQWIFEADANKGRMKSVTRINTTYRCEETKFTYNYHPSGLIDEIVSVRADTCLRSTVKWYTNTITRKGC